MSELMTLGDLAEGKRPDNYIKEDPQAVAGQAGQNVLLPVQHDPKYNFEFGNKSQAKQANVHGIPNVEISKAEFDISEKFSKAKLDLLKVAAEFKNFCKLMASEVKESQEHFKIKTPDKEFNQYIAEMNIHMNSAMNEMFDISEQFKKCGKIENQKIWKAEPAWIMNCVNGTTEILNVNVKRSVMSLNNINANEVPAWFLIECVRHKQSGLSVYAISQLAYAEIAAVVNTVYEMGLKIAEIQPDLPRLPAEPKIEFNLKPENILPEKAMNAIKPFMDKELKKKCDAVLAGIK